MTSPASSATSTGLRAKFASLKASLKTNVGDKLKATFSRKAKAHKKGKANKIEATSHVDYPVGSTVANAAGERLLGDCLAYSLFGSASGPVAPNVACTLRSSEAASRTSNTRSVTQSITSITSSTPTKFTPVDTTGYYYTPGPIITLSSPDARARTNSQSTDSTTGSEDTYVSVNDISFSELKFVEVVYEESLLVPRAVGVCA